MTIALAGSELQQGVRVRGPAQCYIAVPLVIARRHGVAVAVLVVISVRGVADHPHVAQRAAGGGVDGLVEAAVGTGQDTGIDPGAQFAEMLRFALEQDGAGRCPRAPEYGLRALDHGQLVVGFRRDVGRGGVHAAGAGAEHHAAIGEDVQARTEHAAQHRVAVGAAVADQGEAGNGLEVVATVTGRYRLARVLGVGDDGQWRAGSDGRDHQRADFVGMPGVFVGRNQRREQGAAQCAQGEREYRLGMRQTGGSSKTGHIHSNIQANTTRPAACGRLKRQ